MSLARALSLMLMLSSAVWGTRAETVWRCSGPAGTQYSQHPCPGGKPVDVADERSDDQRRVAQEAAAKEAALAERLSREREQREVRVQPSMAIGIRGERGQAPVARSATAPPPANKAGSAKGSKKKKKKDAPRPLKQPA